MIEAEWWEYDSAEEMADAVAGDVGFIIESALDARGSSLIALPGGNTPKAIYKALAAKTVPPTVCACELHGTAPVLAQLPSMKVTTRAPEAWPVKK